MNLQTMSKKADECADKLLAEVENKTMRTLIIAAYITGVSEGAADALAELQTRITLNHAARKG